MTHSRASQITDWLTARVEEGDTEFTIADLKSATDLLFGDYKMFSMRTLYALCREYVHILGVPVERRPRPNRNFNELIFTPVQLSELLNVIDHQRRTRQGYGEIFVQMREAQRAQPLSEATQQEHGSAGAVALRTEVAQLRQQLETMQAAALTQEQVADQLWRLFLLLTTIPAGEAAAHLGIARTFLRVAEPEERLVQLEALLEGSSK